ncbi:ParB N-terminal domain-containing protein [Citrobacter freundii]
MKDLIASFKANGYLDVDVIQVKDLGDNNYLVLEGNRRVTALKYAGST